ncbi:hypothetical protein [Arcobacter sp. YIC-310]
MELLFIMLICILFVGAVSLLLVLKLDNFLEMQELISKKEIFNKNK